MPTYPALPLAIAVAVGLATGPGTAQDADAAAETALRLELNTVTPLEAGCRLTFMATNGLGADLNRLVLETVLITTDGLVDRLTLFDMRALPADRPRVRQFDVPELACDALGRVLINAVATCEGDGIDPGTCSDRLDLSSRSGVEILG